jgi:ABC-2 type transport system ATP-binding protein
METAAKITDLSVTVDRVGILHDISASLPAGKVIGLLGPSGAGKTTLIRTILGLQKPSSGNVEVLGMPAGVKKLKSQIGYISQSPSIYADLSVIENLHYFADLLGVERTETERVLQEVELQDQRDQLVSSLSGGQQARVSLAVALLGKPRLLLLDEPTVGLDPVLRQKLWRQFHDLAASGVTILISSHSMDEADKCDEILFLRHGRLLASGAKDDILERTKATSMEDAFLKLASATTQGENE